MRLQPKEVNIYKWWNAGLLRIIISEITNMLYEQIIQTIRFFQLIYKENKIQKKYSIKIHIT